MRKKWITSAIPSSHQDAWSLFLDFHPSGIDVSTLLHELGYSPISVRGWKFGAFTVPAFGTETASETPSQFMKSDELYAEHSRSCFRIDGALQRGAPLMILVDGGTVRAYAGESIMAALLASGWNCFGRTLRRNSPRGPYCGIGICFDRVMTVDDRRNVRTWQTPVSDGMRIETQGEAHHETESG